MEGRIFVIGIDGGDPSLIKSWAEEGKLPNLKSIMDKGSFGNLRSTIPPITGAAWSSFQTGTNPGKHGAFNWFKRKKGEYRAIPVNVNDISEPTLWQILGQMEKEVGVLGVPVTYPVRPVNGFLVSGLLTPAKSKRQSYPTNIIDEVRKIDPDFKFSPKEWTRGYDPEEWVNEMIDDVHDKMKVTRHLMNNKNWDFMMVHFMETDQVQHYMWNYFDKEGDWNPVLDIYQAVDRAIGHLQEELEEEDTLLIMSDHGFGPLRYNFHIDTWLLEEGYIQFKKNIPTRFKQLAFKMGLTKESVYPVGQYVYPLARKAGLVNTAMQLASNPWLEWFFLSSQNVNWSETKAYSHSEIGHIYLNVKGREPEGAIKPEDVPAVQEELIEKLKKLENPYTGKKIVGEIYKGKEYYHGDKVDGAPDIVFLPADMEILGKGAYEFLSHRVVSKSMAQSGHHRMNGVFLARGPNIKSGNEIETAHIMDIAPTILYKLDLPLFNHMDGEVIEEIFEEDYREENDREYIDKEDLDLDLEVDDDNDGEEDEMKRRLKGLGYVS